MWRERGSSPGSGPSHSPSRDPQVAVAVLEWTCATARYSGGAASVLHRLPCPVFANQLLQRILCQSIPLGKRLAQTPL